MSHVHCCDPEPPIPDVTDLADTLCYLRAHPHLAKSRSCKPAREEVAVIVTCLRLLADSRDRPTSCVMCSDEFSAGPCFGPGRCFA